MHLLAVFFQFAYPVAMISMLAAFIFQMNGQLRNAYIASWVMLVSGAPLAVLSTYTALIVPMPGNFLNALLSVFFVFLAWYNIRRYR